MAECAGGMVIREKALAYTPAPTFAEFLESVSSVRSLLWMRYQEVRIAPDDQLFFSTYPQTLHLLVIVNEESPETIAVLPILVRIAEAGSRLNLRILREEDAPAALALLVDEPELLNSLADADFPLLLILDEEWQLQEQWGPHPQAAEAYLDEWLARVPEYETAAEDDSPQGPELSARRMERLTHEMRALLAGLLDDGEMEDRAE
jgi:hypothetical protein